MWYWVGRLIPLLERKLKVHRGEVTTPRVRKSSWGHQDFELELQMTIDYQVLVLDDYYSVYPSELILEKNPSSIKGISSYPRKSKIQISLSGFSYRCGS